MSDRSADWPESPFPSPEADTPPELPVPPRRGDSCPRCARGRLDYDGLLNLACAACGFTLAGCFT
jgi:uncharacterized protein (DUF983 family)